MKYKEFDSAAEVFDMLARVRGHNMAKAGLETAIWDAEAKQKNLPLAKLLGGSRDEISSGVSIGIQPDIETAPRQSGKGTSRRLPAHQNKNQTWK